MFSHSLTFEEGQNTQYSRDIFRLFFCGNECIITGNEIIALTTVRG